MVEEYMEISKEDIENVENALKVNADYKLNNTKFNTNTFEKGQSKSFELFIDNIIGGNVSRDVFQSVYQYFHEVIADEENDFADEKAELINFLVLTEEYEEDKLQRDLDPAKIRQDYKADYDRIYGDESMNRVQKSLALKELLHMSICQVVNDIDLFFTRPYDLTPEENAEKNRQEAKALENEMQLT